MFTSVLFTRPSWDSILSFDLSGALCECQVDLHAPLFGTEWSPALLASAWALQVKVRGHWLPGELMDGLLMLDLQKTNICLMPLVLPLLTLYVCAGLWEEAAKMQNKYKDRAPPLATL